MEFDYYKYVRSLDNYLRDSNKYIDDIYRSITAWNNKQDEISGLLVDAKMLLDSYYPNISELEELADYGKNVEDYAWFDQLSDIDVADAYAKYDEVQEAKAELQAVVDEIRQFAKFFNSFNI
jgi:hypothetical protein